MDRRGDPYEDEGPGWRIATGLACAVLLVIVVLTVVQHHANFAERAGRENVTGRVTREHRTTCVLMDGLPLECTTVFREE